MFGMFYICLISAYKFADHISTDIAANRLSQN